jgi:dienelactone hydrolase
MSKLRLLLLILGLVVLLVLGGFVFWAETPLGPMPEALAALESDGRVAVDTDPWLTFTPLAAPPTDGIIIYPGGRVDARSYAPLARAFAAETGLLAVIVPMPLNLAVTDANAAADVIAAHPEIDRWIIGGHSLGGSMAASFAAENDVDALALWASYPANDALAARTDLPIVSLYGTNDGVATPDDINASRPNLPPNTIFAPIEGGNHAQFGWYGDQPGDNPATISRAEQQAQVVRDTAALLQPQPAGAAGG